MGRSVNPQMQTDKFELSWSADQEAQNKIAEMGIDVQDIVNQVNQFMENYVDARLHPNIPLLFQSEYGGIEQSTAFYHPKDNVIVVQDLAYTTISVIAHEIGHAIEKNFPETYEIVRDFFNSRYVNNDKKYIADKTIWAPDDFPDWYCGLMDSRSETAPVEVLSMGISMLFTDPIEFAKKYPEYYRMVTVLLSGKWIDQKTKSSIKSFESRMIKLLMRTKLKQIKKHAFKSYTFLNDVHKRIAMLETKLK